MADVKEKHVLLLDSITDTVVREAMSRHMNLGPLDRTENGDFPKATLSEIHYIIFSMADEIKRLRAQLKTIVEG